ncbi:MAG: SnoaL-like domain-containing protein [Rhodobacteraceae bacterium]|nr:SnoaL-like domain-containing protein [Paracoccaceae bacterium]
MTDIPTSIANLLHSWADRTAHGQSDAILRDHAPSAVFFDVLPPLRHDATAAYRETWDGWQPQTAGGFTFRLEDLDVTEGPDHAFAHGLLRCGGTTPDGRSFADLVRATFCLFRTSDGWRIVHQHISVPKDA